MPRVEKPHPQAKPKVGKQMYAFSGKKVTKRITAEIAKKSEHLQQLSRDRDVSRRIIAGQSYEHIADCLGISVKEAFESGKAIAAKWGGDLSHSVQEMREIEIRRLDALWAQGYSNAMPRPARSLITGQPIQATDINGEPVFDDHGQPVYVLDEGNVEWARFCLNISDRRAKLLGLDAADKMKREVVEKLLREYKGVNPDEL